MTDNDKLDDKVLDMACRLADAKALKTRHSAALKQVTAKIAILEKDLAEKMVTRELSNFRLAGIGQFVLNMKRCPRMINKERFFAWLRNQGDDDIIETTINAQTLRSYITKKTKWWKEVKGGKLDDELLPMISIFEKPSISLRR